MKKLLLLLALLPFAAVAGEAPDGPGRVLSNALLDHLVGSWALSGPILGQSAELTLTAEWVLNHQFLHIHEKARSAAAGQVTYEAEVYIGYDNASDRYVAHWIDVYGGRFSETLGYGPRTEDRVALVFEYPDGPFHNTMTWNTGSGTWHVQMEQKGPDGKWHMFADQTAVRNK